MNWFSEDGQLLSHSLDWQQCHEEVRRSRLSALFESVRSLEACEAREHAEQMMREWQTERAALHALAEGFASDLPRAASFFVDDRERRESYAALCRFYTLAAPHFDRMRELSSHVRALFDRMREIALREDLVLRETLLAKHAAEQETTGDVRTRVRELAEVLYGVRERNAELRRRLDLVSDAWLDFCTKRFPALTARIGACADMEHEGAACDPRALSVLCAELVQLLGASESGT